jgi:ubiquinone/menaquinone biosynthesis C-methylase UbiE
MVSSEIQKQRAIETHSFQARQFADSYQALEADAYQNCFTYSRHRLERLLESHLPARGDGLSLLDLGCGTGHHAAKLRQLGFTVAGVDGSADMLEIARANNPGMELQQSDVETIPYESNRFDYVVCIEVLRYLPDIARCVQEIGRVLKPGGVALVTAHPTLNLNGYWLVNRITSRMQVGSLVQLKQYFATSGQLRRAFRNAGCASTEVHGVYLGPINWVGRLAPALLPKLLKAWEPVDVRLANKPLLREFSNMFLVRAVKN